MESLILVAPVPTLLGALPVLVGAGEIVVAVAVIVALLAVVAVISIYNQLVALAVRADGAWSDIDVQLKRRHDLIPNVVETVKGYTAYEKETFEAVVAARAKAMGAQGAKDAAAAEDMLSGALKSLFALSENYPQLRASEQFTHLQQQLATIEESLQGARRYYNATVRELNTAIRSFPTNLLAGPAGASKREFFEVSNEAERAVPNVKLT